MHAIFGEEYNACISPRTYITFDVVVNMDASVRLPKQHLGEHAVVACDLILKNKYISILNFCIVVKQLRLC